MSASAPFYRIHAFVCTNRRPAEHPRRSCGHHGGIDLHAYLKARVGELGLGEVRINTAGCFDRCESGPLMVIYPEGVWYAVQSTGDIDEIVTSHLVQGKRVERLLLA
jgi:(2Fe-2S) ferredoxin